MNAKILVFDIRIEAIICLLLTVADWESMGRVITQRRGRVVQTLNRAFETLDRGFSFLLNA